MFHNFTYGYNNGIAVYKIKYKRKIFSGTAHCHPDDRDMESERVGLTVAESRANIKVLTYIKENELEPQLKILNHVYANMKSSKYFNPKSYETKSLRRQIHILQNELNVINKNLVEEKKFLKDYVKGKEKIYKKIRAKRQ